MEGTYIKKFFFIDKCKKLISDASDNIVVQQNGSINLYPGKVPNAKHKFYAGLTDAEVEEMKSQYSYSIPVDYIQLLQYSNGMSIFEGKMSAMKGKYEIATGGLTLFGIPRVALQGDLLEPFDIRVEDLRRHKKNPKTWLKIGTYPDTDRVTENGLFMDVISGHIYSCEDGAYKIKASWNSLEDALGELFDYVSALPDCVSYN